MSPKTVGELLKQGRLRQKLSIGECAKRTHISIRFLEALEDERWRDLPSESHRLGFLRAYSHFLGVPADETMLLYQKGKNGGPTVHAEATFESSAKQASNESAPSAKAQSPAWFPRSWEQLVGLIIAALLVAWGIYHAVGRHEGSEPQHINLWTRPRAHQARLIPVKLVSTVQKIRIHAKDDSWLRVNEGKHLLFEGILPAGSTKDWSGQGPYSVRLANVQAVDVFWNDQAVDVAGGAHGGMASFQLPLAKAPASDATTAEH